MAVPVRADLLRAILDHGHRLEIGRQRVFTGARQRLTDIARALPRRDRLLEGPRQRFDHASGKLASALTLLVHQQRARLDRAAAGLTPGPLSADRAAPARTRARLHPPHATRRAPARRPTSRSA